MRKLWAVTKREYLERVRTRWFVIATLFGPVFFGAIMFLPAYMAAREQASSDVARIHVIDATGTALGTRVASELNGGPLGDSSLTRVVVVEADGLAAAESTAVRAIRDRSIKGYLVLGEAALQGTGARYVGTNATAIADVERLQSVVSRETMGLEYRRMGISDADAERLTKRRFRLQTERMTPSGRGGSGRVSLVFALVVGMLLYMTILLYGQAVLRGVVEEKQSRVAEVVVSSVRPSILLGGKVLGVGAVGLTQMVVWIVAGALIMKARVPLMQRMGLSAAPMPLPDISGGMVVLLVLFFLFGYTFYSALFAAVGATVNSEQEAQQAQMPVMLMLVMSIMFLQPVLSAPDSTMAVAMSIIPFSAPIIMPLRLSAADVPVAHVALSVGVLVASCLLALLFAAKVYRVGLLMYGKRATLGEMLRWIRS